MLAHADESPMSHHKDTQNRIQGIVPILRFLLLFRGVPFGDIKSIFSIEEAHLPRIFALSVDGLFVSIKIMGIR